MYHPYFFDFFYLSDNDGGFQLRSGPFSLSEFGGIVSGLHCAFYVSLLYGIHHCNRPALSSKTDKYRKKDHTSDIESRLIAKKMASNLANRQKP